MIYALRHQLFAYRYLSDLNAFLAVMNGLSWFLFFKNIRIRKSKVINAFGGATFGVLLIHANSDAMRRWLWRDTLRNVDVYSSSLVYLHAILSVLEIFMICAGIDIFRQKFLEKPLFSNYEKWGGRLEIYLKKKYHKDKKEGELKENSDDQKEN